MKPLPPATHPPRGAASPAGAQAGTGSPAFRVLVADDSAVTRRVMGALISNLVPGAEIVEAADGAQTAQRLSAEALDIAFVDLHMPDMPGPRAVALGRRRGSDPLVVLMGDNPDEWTGDGRIRAYEFLQKPLEEDELRLIFGNLSRMKAPARLLVVDDSKASRRLIGKVLESSRFTLEVEMAESGEYALTLLKRQAADVVLLDYDMPGIDGLETACLIQELMPQVRVVVITASQNPAVERAARYFGAVHFLRKPFYARQVDRALHVAFDLPLTSFMTEPVPPAREAGRTEAAVVGAG